ncbi:MAG: beta-ketoacyl synthase N-terminal-like domain-containing protein, partial [Alphaproteobacteria bacterium]
MNENSNWNHDSGRGGPGSRVAPTPIAIIGMGCRLPGGVVDYDGMWQFLLDRGIAIREIPEDRWNVLGY